MRFFSRPGGAPIELTAHVISASTRGKRQLCPSVLLRFYCCFSNPGFGLSVGIGSAGAGRGCVPDARLREVSCHSWRWWRSRSRPCHGRATPAGWSDQNSDHQGWSRHAAIRECLVERRSKGRSGISDLVQDRHRARLPAVDEAGNLSVEVAGHLLGDLLESIVLQIGGLGFIRFRWRLLTAGCQGDGEMKIAHPAADHLDGFGA